MRSAIFLGFGAMLLAWGVAGAAGAETPVAQDEVAAVMPAAPEQEPAAAAPADDSGLPGSGESAVDASAGAQSPEWADESSSAEASEPEPDAEVAEGAAESQLEATTAEVESVVAEMPSDEGEVVEAEPPVPVDTPVTSQEPAEGVAEEAAVAAPPAPLGMAGYDAQGRPGRIHLVVPGDTLWDISEAYLGTPWVWPSIWKDNREIENPHLIKPGERIWITPSEMRRVSSAEAEALLAGLPAAPERTEVEEALPVSEPEEALPDLAGVPEAKPVRRVSSLESVGLVTPRELESAASIIDAVPDRVMLSQGDLVYIGLGEGDTEVGDEFAIFRTEDRVVDPDTKRLLGFHVNILGWAEVVETHEETSVASIRLSSDDIARGDRLMPRAPIESEIPVLEGPANVEGKLAYFAQSRTMMGMVDFVYLNRGALDGIEVGSPLEVYRPAYVGKEVARGERVRVPELVVADLLVVKAEENSSVAFVTHTDRELALGDRFRGARQ